MRQEGDDLSILSDWDKAQPPTQPPPNRPPGRGSRISRGVKAMVPSSAIVGSSGSLVPGTAPPHECTWRGRAKAQRSRQGMTVTGKEGYVDSAIYVLDHSCNFLDRRLPLALSPPPYPVVSPQVWTAADESETLQMRAACSAAQTTATEAVVSWPPGPAASEHQAPRQAAGI